MKTKQPSKIDIMRTSTERSARNQSTTRLQSRRRVLQVQSDELDLEIAMLSAAAAKARETRKQVAAALAGLDDVLWVR